MNRMIKADTSISGSTKAAKRREDISFNNKTGCLYEAFIKRIPAVVALLTVILLTVFGSFVVQANGRFVSGNDAQLEQQTEPERVKCYLVITVHSGDTLWGIAKKYITPEYSSINDYIDELRDINNIKQDKIISGTKIMVTYYKNYAEAFPNGVEDF